MRRLAAWRSRSAVTPHWPRAAIRGIAGRAWAGAPARGENHAHLGAAARGRRPNRPRRRAPGRTGRAAGNGAPTPAGPTAPRAFARGGRPASTDAPQHGEQPCAVVGRRRSKRGGFLGASRERVHVASKKCNRTIDHEPAHRDSHSRNGRRLIQATLPEPQMCASLVHTCRLRLPLESQLT